MFERTYFGHLEFDAAGSLPIGNGKIGRKAGVSDYRRQRIAVLVRKPLTAWMSGRRESEAECGKTRTICSDPRVL